MYSNEKNLLGSLYGKYYYSSSNYSLLPLTFLSKWKFRAFKIFWVDKQEHMRIKVYLFLSRTVEEEANNQNFVGFLKTFDLAAFINFSLQHGYKNNIGVAFNFSFPSPA